VVALADVVAGVDVMVVAVDIVVATEAEEPRLEDDDRRHPHRRSLLDHHVLIHYDLALM